ncbi:MAG: DUF4339 domain-containing protein [Nitriliruptoraceae bacterium]
MDEHGSTQPDPARWYYLEGGDQRGPVNLADIRAKVLDGTVGPDSYVWADGMPEWMPARQVPAVTPPAETRATLPAWG